MFDNCISLEVVDGLLSETKCVIDVRIIVILLSRPRDILKAVVLFITRSKILQFN